MTDARATFRLQGEDATAQAFKSALGRTQAFSKQAASVMKGAFLGISLATITGAIGRSIELGDELNKAAIKAGLAGSAMSELAHAANMADVDLASLSTGLKFMQVNLSKIAEGSKEGEKTLAALGLRLDSIKGLKADAQFELIAEKIASLKDPADRTRAAVEIFGRAGADLLPLFEQGAEGIRKAREEAKRLGIALSDEQIATLAEADDAIKRLSASFRGLSNVLVSAVGPTLSRTLDGFTRIIQAAREGKTWIDLYREIRAEQSKADRTGVIERPTTTAPGFGAADELQTIASAIEKAMKDAEEASKKAKEEAAKAAQEALRSFELDPETLDRISFEDWKRETVQATDEVVRASQDMDAELQRIGDDMQQSWEAATDELSTFADQAARNMQDAFADFLFDPFKDGINGMLKGFVNILRRMAAEAVASKIFESLGFGSGGGGGGGLGGLFKSFTGLFGFANGGQFKVGGSGGTDSQLVAFRASPNETVTVTRPDQRMGGPSIVLNYSPQIDARGADIGLTQRLPAILSEQSRRIFDELDRRYGLRPT